MDDQTKFWHLGHEAIREGLITMDELKEIARVGTRKARYWGRHLRDLEEILTDRRRKREEDADKR